YKQSILPLLRPCLTLLDNCIGAKSQGHSSDISREKAAPAVADWSGSLSLPRRKERATFSENHHPMSNRRAAGQVLSQPGKLSGVTCSRFRSKAETGARDRRGGG